MRYAIAALLLLTIISCKKENEDESGGVTDNSIPSNDYAYPFIHINFDNDPHVNAFLRVNDIEAYPGLGYFSTNRYVKSNIYKSWLEGINSFPGPATCPLLRSPVVGNSHFYVDVRNINHSGTGLLNLSSSPYTLPGGGKITYSPNSFLYNYEDVWFTYINPAAKKFIMSSPDITVDLDQKRWFLKSFGEFYMNLPRFRPGGAPVYMEYPIPSTLVAEAPDSVQTWLFSTTVEKWIPKGYAVKTGSAYKFQVTEEGIWNFAKKVKGLYKYIQFKTDQGVAISNAIIRITNNTRELASVRTNPEGFASCYLPTGEAMTAEVLTDWSGIGITAFSLPIPAFENEAVIYLTAPASSVYITTISGNMKKCSGAVITQGQVRLVHTNLSQMLGHIVFSAVGGVYRQAFISKNNILGLTARPYDVQNNLNGRDTTFLIRTAQDNMVNFTTCQ